MLNTNSRWLGLGFRLLAIVLALVFTTIILVLTGASPFEAFSNIIVGSLGSSGKISDTLVAWVPLLLATSGLLVTFTAGLWNIGIEGQITLGAIFTTFVLRSLQDTGLPPVLTMILGILGWRAWGSVLGVDRGLAQDLRRGE